MTATPTRRVASAARSGAPRGIVTAIVAITGHEDQVNDLILPGAFAVTLKKRRPKVVFHHDFRDFVGKVLSIAEWAPGDPRLPRTTPDGTPWPPGAGAVVATMQFNMRTERGREAYEWVAFYHASAEAAWSIGYKATLATKRADGVRLIYALELFEVSIVLHGAHDWARTLETKSGLSDTEQAQRAFAQTPLAGTLAEVSRIRCSPEVKTAMDAVMEAKALTVPEAKMLTPTPAGDLRAKLIAAIDVALGAPRCCGADVTCADCPLVTPAERPVESGVLAVTGGLAAASAALMDGSIEVKSLEAAVAGPLNDLLDALALKGVDAFGLSLDAPGTHSLSGGSVTLPTLGAAGDVDDEDDDGDPMLGYGHDDDGGYQPPTPLRDLEQKRDRADDETADLLGTRTVDSRPGADVNPKAGDLYRPTAADPLDEDETSTDKLERKSREPALGEGVVDVDADPAVEDDEDDMVSLDPADVAAELAALRA